MENIITYYPTAIGHAPGVDTIHILNLIRNNSNETHFIIGKGFNPTFLRSCFNEPNCKIIFFKGDGFDEAARNEFIAGTPPDRKKSDIIFLSGNSTRDEMVDILTREVSLHIWNTDTHSCPTHTLLFLANSAQSDGRLAINATGYSHLIIDMTLDPASTPIVYIRKTDNFVKSEIQRLIQKGGTNIHILAEGFSDADLADFTGATIITSNLMV